MLRPLVPIVKNSKAIKEDGWQELPEAELSKLIEKNNGGNIGVRLDNYAVIDPDEPAAETFCNNWERKGILVPTVAWKTARGFTKRLYLRPEKWPFSSQTASIANMKLQLRSGSGVQDVIPPSTINGNTYRWLPGRSPDELAPVPLPDLVLEHFINYSSSSSFISFKKDSSTSNSKSYAKTLDFGQGGRDESLFHVAHTLFKGGMCEEDVLEIVIRLASSCNPPFSLREAQAKVASAKKRAISKEVNVAEVIKNFIIGTEEDIKRTVWVKECGFWDNLGQREAAYKAITRLNDEGFIAGTGKRGWYRRVQGEAERINFMAADTSSFWKIQWPFRLHQLVKIFPKNLIVIAGDTNAGKTAFLLEFCRLNMRTKGIKIRYISTEMQDIELRERLNYYAADQGEFYTELEEWDKLVDFRFRLGDPVIDVIQPNRINVVDYYDAEGEFYDVAREFKQISQKLDKGIAIIAIQKKPGAKQGYGGALTEMLPRFALALEKGKITINKAKNIMPGIGKSADGFSFKFKLVQGYQWIPQDPGSLFWWWNYKDEESETLAF